MFKFFCYQIFALSLVIQVVVTQVAARIDETQKTTSGSPMQIASQKCIEYAKPRFTSKVEHRPPLYHPVKQSRLDCLPTELLINNGQAAVLKEFPHMALIGYHDNFEDPDQEAWRCSGSLISDRFVLTAAHCQMWNLKSAKWVRLGELVYKNDSDKAMPRDFQIEKAIPHPKYAGISQNHNSGSIENDIMLLKLNESVKFSPFIRPICLNVNETLPKLNDEVIATGWGGQSDTRNDGALKKVTIRALDKRNCIERFKKEKSDYIMNNTICAGDPLGSKDTCDGDSGGPLQIHSPGIPCMYIQVGITSKGQEMCGKDKSIAIYTKVYSYLNWIQEIVWP